MSMSKEEIWNNAKIKRLTYSKKQYLIEYKEKRSNIDLRRNPREQSHL